MTNADNSTRSIYFVRHANTDKKTPDSARRITELGFKQARRRRELMGHPVFDAGYCSPLQRTLETLQTLAGVAVEGNALLVKIIAELVYDENTPEGKLMGEAFNKLGYASVGQYMEQCDQETVGALVAFGIRAWESICLEGVFDLLMSPVGGKVIVVGHAVLLGFIVYAAFSGAPWEKICSINLGECEGVRVDFDTAGKPIGMEMITD